MKYQTLKAGDIRRQGDQVRSNNCTLHINQPADHNNKWRNTDLVGFAILESDLMCCELRGLV